MTSRRKQRAVGVVPPPQDHIATLQRRIRVARGQEPGDLLLRGGHVVNVFTERVERADVIIADGWIAGVGPYDWQARETLDIHGRYVTPSLCDAHVHLESTLLIPSEFAKLAAARGTSFVVADPHEIANVSGVAGIELILDATEDLPIDVFIMVPSCVPASPWESPGATIELADIERLHAHPRVLGLAEMMNYPGVLAADADVLAKVAAAQRDGGRVDGHAPLVLGQDLQAYAAAGIRSDHESTTVEEALEKSALGMLIQVRDGSMARNLSTFAPLIKDSRLANWCLATDDIHVSDLLDRGHIDFLAQQLIDAGVYGPCVLRHASLVPAMHYGLTDRGAVAPSYHADLVVLDDLTRFTPSIVVHAGRIVARDGAIIADVPPATLGAENSVRIGSLDESVFELKPGGAECPVVEIVPDEIVTRSRTQAVRTDDRTGRWVFDPSTDIAAIACVERHRASGRVGVGLVGGMGLRRDGALGSSVAHDAHNLVVAGTNAGDMLACTRALADMGGGFVVVTGGEIVARLPLELAGLMSTEPYEAVDRQLREVEAAAHHLGSALPSPFGTLSFLCLSVIPELRITDRGVFNVNRQQIVRL